MIFPPQSLYCPLIQDPAVRAGKRRSEDERPTQAPLVESEGSFGGPEGERSRADSAEVQP